MVGGRAIAFPARVTIAADGRRSVLAFGLGLARHPASPRRWAIGAYFADFGARVPGTCQARVRPQPGTGTAPTFGEMHIRSGRYIGVAPVPGGLTNVCLVRPAGPADPGFADAAALLTRELARDPLLADRAAAARMVAPPAVLGPLAVDVVPAATDGLLLAGDAAGFIDPMTGDGLRFAIRGGELAAFAALDALASGWAAFTRASRPPARASSAPSGASIARSAPSSPRRRRLTPRRWRRALRPASSAPSSRAPAIVTPRAK